jgi:hypothetical protein
MNIPLRKEEGSYAYSLRERERSYKYFYLPKQTLHLTLVDRMEPILTHCPIVGLGGQFKDTPTTSYGPITLKSHAHLAITLSPRRGTILWLLIGVRFLPLLRN